MSRITETLRAVGAWEITFDGVPQELVDQLDELGHIVVTEAAEQGPSLGDNLLTSARYTGVVRGRKFEKDSGLFTLDGPGLAWWLGTEDKVGDVLETAKTYSANTFSSVITDLLPSSITVGTLTNGALPAYTGTHQWVSRREAIDYVCDTVGATWRVRPNGTLDAGPQASVFASGRAVIVRRAEDAGEDMTVRAIPGPAEVARDMEDFTTRVVVLGKVEDDTVVQGTWDIAGGLNPYKDLHGNAAKLTRVASESTTEGVNADARASAIGEQYENPQRAVTLDSVDYELGGVVECGDMVWLYDPDSGLVDANNEVMFRGRRLNPVAEQVTSLTWPVRAGMGVYYRSRLGVWLDLSRYLVASSDTTQVEVGKNSRDLVSSGGSPTGRIPEPDTSIPNVPTFTTPFKAATYAQGDTGVTRAQVQVKWQMPATNTDGSDFVDGSHFEIGYRPSSDPAYPATYAQAAAAGTYSSLGTWGQPVATAAFSDWQTAFAPIDATTALISELPPGTPIDFRIRVLDSATPPNASSWSSTYTQYMPVDVDPPAVPAAPVVAGSKIAVLVKHYLGADTGGTFNLAQDLAGLKVHIGTTSTFTIDARSIGDGGTLAGRIVATKGQILGQIPVMGTFQVDTTSPLWVRVTAYDLAGNESDPSASAAVTAQLIDDQWISNLTVDKLTSGTLTASVALAGEFLTAPSGQRMRTYWNGIEAYLSDGVTKFVDLDIANQTILIAGTIQSALSGTYWQMNPDGTLRHYATGYAGYSQLTSLNGDLILRGRLDGNSRSGRINANSIGVGINFSSDAEITSGNLRAEVAVFDRIISHISPLHRFYINEKLSSPDAFQRRISFGKLNSSGADVSASTVWFTTDGSDNPGFFATGANAGLKFESAQVSVVNGAGTFFGPIKATSFVVSSSQETKQDIREIGSVLDTIALFKAVPSKAWSYTADANQTPPATPDNPNPDPVIVTPPVRFGPIAEDLPAVLRTGIGPDAGIDLAKMGGATWDVVHRILNRQQRVAVGRTTVTTGVWLAGSTREITVAWDEKPLATPAAGAVMVYAAIAWLGKTTATVKPGSITSTGCTLVVKALAAVTPVVANPITYEVQAAYDYFPPYVPEAA